MIMDRLNPFTVKKEICDIGRRMYDREFVAANDGNISVRISDNEIVTTPTGVSKGFMTPDMMVTVNPEGAVLEGKLKPSSELKMHLKVYRERPEVRSVVHAHPITATAFSVCGMGLDKAFMPELVVTLGMVPLARYATPSTQEIPDSISDFLADYNAVLLANHGALTWGRSLMEAYFRMESVEFSAKIVMSAMQIGNPSPIPCDKMDALVKIRESMGIRGVLPACGTGLAPAKEAQPSLSPGDMESIISRVAERVSESLRRK